MTQLETEITDADVVVSCTGADALVVSADVVARAMAVRSDRPLFVLDVALPRDVDPAAAAVPGVTLSDLDALKPILDTAARADDILEARRIVDEELAAYSSARRASGVAPTVVALRDKAAQVVAAELHRLERRLPALDDAARDEIGITVRRVVDKLLHSPTVRVQELAGTAGPESYPEALRRLFDLDPAAPAAIAAPAPADLDQSGEGGA
jgi:glutamyl-tRNA reductase